MKSLKGTEYLLKLCFTPSSIYIQCGIDLNIYYTPPTNRESVEASVTKNSLNETDECTTT